jgi:hypothetical protein
VYEDGALTALVETLEVALGVLDCVAGTTVDAPDVVGPAVTLPLTVADADEGVEVAGVPVTATDVPGVVVPPASAVLAMAVCVPRLATTCSGSWPEGNGDTNRPVDIRVGVARGACE